MPTGDLYVSAVSMDSTKEVVAKFSCEQCEYIYTTLHGLKVHIGHTYKEQNETENNREDLENLRGGENEKSLEIYS